jgi:hypothetical protein
MALDLRNERGVDLDKQRFTWREMVSPPISKLDDDAFTRVARQLYAEIASIEEQHVTQYESIIDPDETWLEKWVLHDVRVKGW